MSQDKLSHYDAAGSARMVDVGSARPIRGAQRELMPSFASGPMCFGNSPENPKGNPLEVARIRRHSSS